MIREREPYTKLERSGANALERLGQLRIKLSSTQDIKRNPKGRHPLPGAEANVHFINGPITEALGDFANEAPYSLEKMLLGGLFHNIPISEVIYKVGEGLTERLLWSPPFDFQIGLGRFGRVQKGPFVEGYFLTPELLQELWDIRSRQTVDYLNKLTLSKIIDNFQGFVRNSTK